MLTKKTILSFMVLFGCCQVSFGQSYNAPNSAGFPSSYPNPGTETPPLPMPDPSTSSGPVGYGSAPGGYAMNQLPSGYGLEAQGGYFPDSGCVDGGCMGSGCIDGGSYCAPPPHWAHRWFFWSYWKLKGLPSPWHSRGDMPQRVPYVAEPKSNYYFRPYNWFHIPDQQAEAARYSTDPRNPYDNRIIFDDLYEGLE